MGRAQTEAESLMVEYRHALVDGLGSEGAAFTLSTLPTLLIYPNVGVAYSLQDKRLYVLVDGTGGIDKPGYLPCLLLDFARELTVRLKTFVVPDQTSNGQIIWGGKQRGPIYAYRFKLMDSPTTMPTFN